MKRAFLPVIALAACLLASPAMAAVSLCSTPGCAPTDENVLIVKEIGQSILGVTQQTQKAVVFTSPLTGEDLVGDANGQADVSAADGLLNGLTMTMLNNNTFGSATWNLTPLTGNQPNETSNVIVSWFNPVLGVFGSSNLAMNTNGQNFFGIIGTQGERFTGLNWVSSPFTDGWGDIRQVRLGGVGGPIINPVIDGVPEPATWLSMLLGFGALGAVMRRRSQHATPRLSFG